MQKIVHLSESLYNRLLKLKDRIDEGVEDIVRADLRNMEYTAHSASVEISECLNNSKNNDWSREDYIENFEELCNTALGAIDDVANDAFSLLDKDSNVNIRERLIEDINLILKEIKDLGIDLQGKTGDLRDFGEFLY